MPTTLGACQIYSVGKIEIRKEEIYNTVVVSSSSVIFLPSATEWRNYLCRCKNHQKSNK